MREKNIYIYVAISSSEIWSRENEINLKKKTFRKKWFSLIEVLICSINIESHTKTKRKVNSTNRS